MGLTLFYETLLVILVSVLTSAVCLSAFLVSRQKIMFYASVGFLFYFLDVASILQDDFAARSFTELGADYYFLRSFLTLATGAGFLGAFWLMVCEYLGERRRAMRLGPIVTFVVISGVLLVISGDSSVLRFLYYNCRALFLFWILGFACFHYLRVQDPVERQRLGRYRIQCMVLAALGLLMVTEDVVFFLVLDVESVKIGPFVLLAERNYCENLLMLVCAAMMCHFALRQLFIHSHTNPVMDDTSRHRQTAADLMVYASRHQLTQREQEVLDYILRDKDNQNIASSMSLAPSTVKVHVHNILQKTGHANRQELIQDFWKTV